jgi:hypothetical protein
MTAPTTTVPADQTVAEEPRSAEAHVAYAVALLERDVDEATAEHEKASSERERWRRLAAAAEGRRIEREESLQTMRSTLDTLTGGQGGSLRRTRLLEEARAAIKGDQG